MLIYISETTQEFKDIDLYFSEKSDTTTIKTTRDKVRKSIMREH